jgi:hypothetical protein
VVVREGRTVLERSAVVCEQMSHPEQVELDVRGLWQDLDR